MIRWLYGRLLQMYHGPGGAISFLIVFGLWWKERPRRIPCLAGCDRLVWVHGRYVEAEAYCDKDCAYYGPGYWDKDKDKILF